MRYILETIIILITILNIIMLHRNRKLHNEISNTRNTNVDAMLEIIKMINRDNSNYIDSSAKNIIIVLKKYYKIDYCTIFINTNNSLEVIATDLEKYCEGSIIDHCASLLKNKERSAIISKSDEGYLDYYSASKRGIKYSYFIPLNNNIGAIFIENKIEYEENKFEVEFFNVVLNNISIVLQNCIYNDKLAKLAMRDNLTGAYNRNYMNENMTRIIESNQDLVIAIMDIDYFKNVNDTYGHSYGDYVLIKLSEFIKGQLAANDEIYRWGGEEFVLTFVNQHINDVVFKLNRIRELISGLDLNDGHVNSKVTVSFGVANYIKGDSIDMAFKRADKALYDSKESGRNKVSIYNHKA